VGPAVDQLLAQENVGSTTNETLWALTDNLNTVRDLATYDGSTHIADHRVYDAFGNRTYPTLSAVDCVFGYTGKLLDADTNLQNNLNRWYEAATGKWLSEDPIAADNNLYRYCGNGPTNKTDSEGLDPACCPIIGGGSSHYERDPKFPIDDPSQAPVVLGTCCVVFGGITVGVFACGTLLGGACAGTACAAEQAATEIAKRLILRRAVLQSQEARLAAANAAGRFKEAKFLEGLIADTLEEIQVLEESLWMCGW
jgi:RHS repeat-associated protein